MRGATVVAVEVVSARIPMRAAFAHHKATRRESRPVLVRVRLGDGTTGWGEAQPRPYVTGETEESVQQALCGDLGACAVGRDAGDLASAVQWLTGPPARAFRAAAPAAFGALELAVLDAAGRREGRSVIEAMGGLRRFLSPADGAVIGFMPLPAVVLFASRLRSMRKRWIKVKVGGLDDAERLAAVRRVLGEAVELVLDANGAWTADEAIARVRALSSFTLSAVEQPVARDDIDGLAAVTRATGVPVIADESLCTRADAAKLIQRSACTQWNLRVGKCGGVLATVELLRLAREHGIRCHLGVMVGETGVLGAAGRLLAGSAPDLGRIEADEGTFLTQDIVRRTTPAPPAGRLGTPTGPGLGVEIDVTALTSFGMPPRPVEVASFDATAVRGVSSSISAV